VRRRDEAAEARRAMYDELTGLPNRFLFLDRLELALARTDRRQSSAAVILVDIDGFQVVESKAGGRAANEVVKEAADRIQAVIRPGDSAGRLGKSQFGVLCEEIEGEDDATNIAERLTAAIAFPFSAGDVTARLSASAGIALDRGRDADANALIVHAGEALHAAREHGGGRYEVFGRR